MKSGFISIVGRPNVGKSTLLNAILGEKIAITTEKPQTTRNIIRGIYTEHKKNEDIQIVFIDTPGIHRPKTKLGNFMTESALNTFKEADGIIFITDDSLSAGGGDRYILDMLKEVDTPKMLVINKIDIIEPEKFREIFNEYEDMGIFSKIVGTSAKDGKNVEDVINEAEKYTYEGPMFFPEEMITDHPERFIVSEIIREKLLLYMRDEIPHGTAVEIESYDESGKTARISAVIYCERKTHKGMIIGKGGKKLKGIGKSAREEIEALLGQKVYLELWVKVKENWRDDELMLGNLGYRD